MSQTYRGVSFEKGGTAISGNAAPAIRQIQDEFQGKTVIEIGAGKGRNVAFLRELGIRCYSYDPFHGTDTCGFTSTSNYLPSDTRFDIGFTCYVLNVLPEAQARNVVTRTDELAEDTLHVTRSRDVVYSAQKCLAREDSDVISWCEQHDLPLDDAETLAVFGYPTSRGFQRLVLEVPDHELVVSGSGWRLWR